jgi:hypothetical protein
LQITIYNETSYFIKNPKTTLYDIKFKNNSQYIVLDVDECLTPANNCKFACKNLIGSFACICPEGYVQVGTDECRDINECAENANACQNGYCVNLPGSYKCDCFDGFKTSYDGKQCIGEWLPQRQNNIIYLNAIYSVLTYIILYGVIHLRPAIAYVCHGFTF